VEGDGGLTRITLINANFMPANHAEIAELFLSFVVTDAIAATRG
jgi:hypothetical protein